MKNKIEDLRNHLFAALEGLADKDNPMELDRAKAIADVGRVIVDSAKAEVDFLKVAGARQGTGFVPLPEGAVPERIARIGAGPSPCSVCGGRDFRPETNGAGIVVDTCTKCGQHRRVPLAKAARAE